MNVFGSSQFGETNKFISNLEQSIKSFSSKLDTIDHLLEKNHKSVLIQEEETETIQLTCTHIVDRLKKIEISLESKTNVEMSGRPASAPLEYMTVEKSVESDVQMLSDPAIKPKRVKKSREL
ncbi:hypothetical protein QTP88_007105 [Uroleucon formosanum]